MSSTVNDLPKWDVFLSFRGLDTRHNFISFLYKELVGRSIQTFKDDKDLENGLEISQELKHAIEVSKFAVVVFSMNYAGSSWCLDELVSIMERKSIIVIPIFYGVDPAQVRRQTGEVGEQFKKHDSRNEHDKVRSWREALTKLASLSGNCSSPSQDDSDLVDKIADKISQTLDTTGSNGSNLEGIDKHMKALNRLMELNSHKNVKILGIWGRGCEGRSALAKFVYQKIHQEFESHCFLGSVKMISHGRHLSHLKEEFQRRIQGQHARKLSLRCQRVLLVADDVNKMEQVDALASEYYSFGQGSVVIITSHDKQLLLSSGIKDVYEAECLTFQKRCELFRQLAFKETAIYAAFQAFFRPSGAVDLYGSLYGMCWLFICILKYIHKEYIKYVVLARGKHFECIGT